MHLAAKHFIEGVALTSASSLLQKVKGTMANVMGEDDMIDLDTLNLEMGDIKVEMDADAEGDEESDVADTIGKALALVTQV